MHPAPRDVNDLATPAADNDELQLPVHRGDAAELRVREVRKGIRAGKRLNTPDVEHDKNRVSIGKSPVVR